MILISWNVNGIRSLVKRGGFAEFVAETSPDLLCLQETKAHPEQVNLDLPGYEAHWNAGRKRGYSGTAVFTRVPPVSATTGMGLPDHDDEGRLQTVEFEDFYLVNVYTPNSKRGLLRLDYRTKEWDVVFLKYLKRLEKKKPVVFCGDLNVAHKEIDLANPKRNRRNAGFTDEERAGFDRLLETGFIDTFREFTTEGGHYTWWAAFANARERNLGWRIDYFCVSPALRPRLKRSEILCDVMGSDHCPILMELENLK